MNERVYIKSAGDGAWEWRSADANGNWCGAAQYHSSDELKALVGNNEVKATLILSSELINFARVSVTRKEKRYARQLIPYQLEEDILSPIEELHFAYVESTAAKNESALDVYWLEYDLLKSLIDSILNIGFQVSHCVSEAMLLPRGAGSWSIYTGPSTVLIHMAEGVGVSLPIEVLEESFPLILESTEVGQKLDLWAADEGSRQRFLQCLPEQLSDRVNVQDGSLWDIYETRLAPEVDLLQGEFAPQLPLMRWWREWRWVAAAACLAIVVSLFASYGEYRQYNQRYEAALANIEKVYRSVVPHGAIQDAEKQLKSKLRQSGAAVGSQSNALLLISSVAPMIMEDSGTSLRGLHYNINRNELRLHVQAGSFQVIESLRSKIETKGMTAQLINSSASGDKQQARLRVKMR